MPPSRRIERLRPEHAVADFDCGRPELNRFLVRHAWQSQQADASQTYIGLEADTVVGFYTLALGHVLHDAAPERLGKGLAKHPIPLMLLARLAVDRRRQGQGVAKALLKDAMLRTLQAADIAGIRALAVHAKDEATRLFYQHFDFVASPSDPMHLFLLLKDVRRFLSTVDPAD